MSEAFVGPARLGRCCRLVLAAPTIKHSHCTETREWCAPQAVTLLIEACWHANPEKRPQFTEIVETLTDILKKLPRRKGPSDRGGGSGGGGGGGGGGGDSNAGGGKCCTIS